MLDVVSIVPRAYCRVNELATELHALLTLPRLETALNGSPSVMIDLADAKNGLKFALELIIASIEKF